MAARDRRPTSAAPQALIAAVVVGLVLTGIVWTLRPPGNSLAAAEVDSARRGAAGSAGAAPVGLQAAAPEAATGSGRGARPVLVVARALEQRIEDAIERAQASAAKESKGRVDRRNSHVAVLVRELGTGRELVALEPDRPLAPASNMKLVTSAAALVLLGPAWEFETRVDLVGEQRGSRLLGDLVVRAGGDPFYAANGDGRVEARLDPIADGLLAAGIDTIEGDLVLDLRAFSDPAPAPGWPPPEQHWDDYCALAAGLTLNAGILTASVGERTRVGPLEVEVHPSPHGLSQRYDLEAERGARLDARVGATLSAVTVRGKLPTSSQSWEASFSHPAPERLFGAVLRDRLERAGITVRGTVHRARGYAAGQPLVVLRSPLLPVLEPINTHSVNSVTDQLFLVTGEQATGKPTRAGGREATALALERLGVDSTGLVQVDGSGLSRDNRITVRQMAALLDAVLTLDELTARAYLESLAVGGETGTLEDRLNEPGTRGRIHAKTGWISGVSALSGLARPAQQRELVFSILVEYPAEVGGLNTRCWKPMQDEIARLVLEYTP